MVVPIEPVFHDAGIHWYKKAEYSPAFDTSRDNLRAGHHCLGALQLVAVLGLISVYEVVFRCYTQTCVPIDRSA